MQKISIDLNAALPFLPREAWEAAQKSAQSGMGILLSRQGKGSDFLGWLDLPEQMQGAKLAPIQAVAQRLSQDIELVVVVGIGGSYLGAKAVIEALSHSFAALLPQGKHPLVLFAGHNIGEDYLHELLEIMAQRSCACVVISKSGTTTEPALAFRLIKQHIEEKYGRDEAKNRIVAITDASKGALRNLTQQEGYDSFVIADDIGGRFSILSPVGLLPIALAGGDIVALMAGARDMQKDCLLPFAQNPALQYAAMRQALYCNGKAIEILVNFHSKLHYLTEWWKQLYGESEGKDGKGLFPAGLDFTTDLHSMGQYIQDGPRILFETVLSVAQPERQVSVSAAPQDIDGLNYLAERRIDACNKMAELGTQMAHVEGGVPNLRIEVPRLDAYNIGALLYFFEFACGISAYMMDVNPFDQPGVEAYKKNMFRLLGKP